MMKAITIDFYGKEADYVLLENIDDVLEYAEHHCSDVETAAARMIKSNLPPERFDHLASSDSIGQLIAGAVYKTQMNGGSSILEIGVMADEKILRMMKWSLEGEKIMLNHVGGYCFLNENTKILREESYEFTNEPTHVINDNTTYINLENDSDLEQHTIDYLSKIDPNYSYITNLRNYETSDLIDVFKEFVSKGGSIGYIYTTGFDTQQIHQYCSAFKAAGITDIHFEFNAGIADDLQATLDQLREDDDLSIVILNGE